MDVSFLFFAIIWYLVFVLSTTFHEASHAYVAKLGGDLTAYNAGQVTLDPMPHIRREPMGMVFIPLLFLIMNGWIIGWASTPYDPVWARNNHKKAALMSLAGPSANLFLVILSGIIIKLLINNGTFYPLVGETFFNLKAAEGSAFSGIGTMLQAFFILNVLLFTLNMIPLPPFDGSSVITLFMSKEGANNFLDKIHSQGFSMIGLLVVFLGFRYIFKPILNFAINILFN